MPQLQYELHTAITQDRLCPFKVHNMKSARDATCNWHRNIELLHIAGGVGSVQYGAEEISVSSGDTVIVSSGTLHRIYSDTGLDYYCVIIDERFCLENGIDTSRLHFTPIVRDASLGALIVTASSEMKRYSAGEGGLTSAARARSAMLELLIAICEKYAEPISEERESGSHSERYVKKVIEYLNENLTERITLDDIASVCGVTKFHLAREFKHYTGQSVFEYLNAVRCKRADACLRAGMTATEAAFECGFESLSYFSRVYKRIRGVSPSERKRS